MGGSLTIVMLYQPFKVLPQKRIEENWNRLYPEEPYKLDLGISLSKNIDEKFLEALRCTKYDLISAVKRQSPFFYQHTPGSEKGEMPQRSLWIYQCYLICGNL
nr:TPA_asm: hypothetical protein HUJ06_006890 [Nelumbo nucifera]